jgi:predicted transposase YbfD/YdcC
MIVKENQEALRQTIATLLEPPVSTRVACERAVARELGHGRIERRELVSSPVLAGQYPWPGLVQIFRLKRERVEKKTGKQEEEVVYGITSLPKEEAGAAALLKLTRGQWKIENREHYVRDVTYDEDRSQVRDGRVATVMAAFRNVAISLMREAKWENIAAGTRHYAARPWEALALIGISPTIK